MEREIPYHIEMSIVDYLEQHEEDIANGVNDFGKLKDSFEYFMLRKPLIEAEKKRLA